MRALVHRVRSILGCVVMACAHTLFYVINGWATCQDCGHIWPYP